MYLLNGQIDPTQPLAVNRIIPIGAAPEYTEGKLAPTTSAFGTVLNVPYPAINGGGYYPFLNNSVAGSPNGVANVLMVKEVVVENTGYLNEPTTWYWNIRVGDKLQINGSGWWYTVVGPMVVTPQQGNSELFVNVGPPGTQSPLPDIQGTSANPLSVSPEFLFLVNGQDDNGNGWIDEGYDGVDNNYNYEYANGGPYYTDDLLEWEHETWPATILTNGLGVSQQYTIQRRPAPSPNSREVAMPTNVVVDLTTWGNTFQERSQFPPGVINPYTGYVDILVYPNGTVVPTTIYSTPSSFGMSGAFFHFWLAERSDVAAIHLDSNGNPVPIVSGQPVYLPVGNIKQVLQQSTTAYTGPALKGEYRIVTLFTRTGQVTTNDNVQFDNPVNPLNGTTYNPNFPFLATEQGTPRGGP